MAKRDERLNFMICLLWVVETICWYMWDSMCQPLAKTAVSGKRYTCSHFSCESLKPTLENSKSLWFRNHFEKIVFLSFVQCCLLRNQFRSEKAHQAGFWWEIYEEIMWELNRGPGNSVHCCGGMGTFSRRRRFPLKWDLGVRMVKN